MKDKMDIEDLFKSELADHEVAPVKTSYSTISKSLKWGKFGKLLVIGGIALATLGGGALWLNGDDTVTASNETASTEIPEGTNKDIANNEQAFNTADEFNTEKPVAQESQKELQDTDVSNKERSLGSRQSSSSLSSTSPGGTAESPQSPAGGDAQSAKKGALNTVKGKEQAQKTNTKKVDTGKVSTAVASNEKTAEESSKEVVNMDNKAKEQEKEQVTQEGYKEKAKEVMTAQVDGEGDKKSESSDQKSEANPATLAEKAPQSEAQVAKEDSELAINSEVEKTKKEGQRAGEKATEQLTTEVAKNSELVEVSQSDVEESEEDSVDREEKKEELAIADSSKTSADSSAASSVFGTSKLPLNFEFGFSHDLPRLVSGGVDYHSAFGSFVFGGAVSYPFFNDELRLGVGLAFNYERHNYYNSERFGIPEMAPSLYHIQTRFWLAQAPIFVSYKLPFVKSLDVRLGVGLRYSRVIYENEFAFDSDGQEVIPPEDAYGFVVDQWRYSLWYKEIFVKVGKEFRERMIHLKLNYQFRTYHSDDLPLAVHLADNVLQGIQLGIGTQF